MIERQTDGSVLLRMCCSMGTGEDASTVGVFEL